MRNQLGTASKRTSRRGSGARSRQCPAKCITIALCPPRSCALCTFRGVWKRRHSWSSVAACRGCVRHQAIVKVISANRWTAHSTVYLNVFAACVHAARGLACALACARAGRSCDRPRACLRARRGCGALGAARIAVDAAIAVVACDAWLRCVAVVARCAAHVIVRIVAGAIHEARCNLIVNVTVCVGGGGWECIGVFAIR